MKRIHFWAYLTTQSWIPHEPTTFLGLAFIMGCISTSFWAHSHTLWATSEVSSPAKMWSDSKRGHEWSWANVIDLQDSPCRYHSVELSVGLCVVLVMWVKEFWWWFPLRRGHQFFVFSVKIQLVNMLVFVGHMVSVVMHLCLKQPESSHRHYINKRTWVCSNKTVFTKMDSWPLLYVKGPKSWLNKSHTE